MSPKKRISFFIEPEQAERLKTLKSRDGVAEAEAIRRALDAYLDQKGVAVASDQKRTTRPRRK